MRILIDIGHPGHVHLFKHFAWIMQDEGHEVFFTCREKEFEIELLKHYGFKYKSFGRKFRSKAGKLLGLLLFDIKEILASINFKPDVFLSHGSMYASHAAFLLGKPHISFEDTGNWEQVRLYLPFTKNILTSDVFPIDYGDKQIRLKSHHELAYLHPNYFKPNPGFKESIGLKNDEEFVLLRFVAWNATHDAGQKGICMSDKERLVKGLSRHYKVLISSEDSLPLQFENYRVSFKPHQMHDALHYASLFVGEGTTMAMEAAVLGTPSIYINSLNYGNVEDMEGYGLLYNFSNEEDIVNRVLELSSNPDLKKSFGARKKHMLADKIDLTAFLVSFITNYPSSSSMIKENPNLQGI